MQTPDNEPPPDRADSKAEARIVAPGNSWAFPVMWMVIVLILVCGAIYVFKSAMAVPGQVAQKLVDVVAAFKQGTITTSFSSYATSIGGSQYFQFAHLTENVVITQKDEKSYAWGYIPLPDVIVEANAPVTFTYYLDLNDRWDFRLQNNSILVIAPDIKRNKPAVDVSRIAYTVKKDSLLRNTSEAMDNLRKSITSVCYKKSVENIELVRETGRKQTELFVQNWLAKSFTDGNQYPVTVHFRSETRANANGPTFKTENIDAP
jgi:hypothetical protein